MTIDGTVKSSRFTPEIILGAIETSGQKNSQHSFRILQLLFGHKAACCKCQTKEEIDFSLLIDRFDC